jgi:intraflagellar transport protein 88
MVMAAKLVAPNVESSFEQGFDWVIEMIRASPHAEIASELEIAKAIHYLKMKNFHRVRITMHSRTTTLIVLNMTMNYCAGY